jgi:hypothetical protein
MQIKVHTELAKLRLKNREENAQVRADARAAYEQRIQDAANDSFADSSCLASFIENSVTGTVAALLLLFIVEMCSLILCAEALSLEQSTLHLQSSMLFDRKML